MDIRRCENGHFYDAEKSKTCPQCEIEKQLIPPGGVGRNPNHINTRIEQINNDKIPPTTPPTGRGITNQVDPWTKRTPPTPGTIPGSGNDGKTIAFFQTEMGVKEEPVVGWLVCINGEDSGTSFPLKLGRNFIGRGADMDVVLRNDKAVSRKRHAIVLYEPRTRRFIAQPGESRQLFYLNDDVVLASEKLKPYDILTVGRSDLVFVPFCGPKFSWEDWDEK